MIAACLVAVLLGPHRLEDPVADQIRAKGLVELGAHRMLADLTKSVGARVSGSPEAARAVEWTEKQMRGIGLQNVQRIACMVPHWVRGKVERASMTPGGRLAVCALGMSVGTPPGGVEAEVVEVHSLEEAASLGPQGKGKIVFFNRGFDPTLANTFAAYGGAVDQRFGGASAAVKSGAVAVLVRSMTLSKDDEPHTGAMGYEDQRKIPAAALGIKSADRLSAALKKGPVKVKLELSCKTLPDEPSANVCGDLVGSEFPNDVIVIGGHLDSWDLGDGAHDDGAGVTQSLEALRLIKELGLKPRRTIRVVAFMNEENGGRGAAAYAEYAKNAKERAFAAMESDAGGFMPRVFGVSKEKYDQVQPWLASLSAFGIERFKEGGADSDTGGLEPLGAVLFSLEPENQRYFDYHHSRNDTIDKVNPRELEMGAMAMATLAWLISEKGF